MLLRQLRRHVLSISSAFSNMHSQLASSVCWHAPLPACHLFHSSSSSSCTGSSKALGPIKKHKRQVTSLERAAAIGLEALQETQQLQQQRQQQQQHLQQQNQWQRQPQRPQHPQQLLQQHWSQQRMTPPAAAATQGPPTFDDELMQQQQPQKRPKKRVGNSCCHRYAEIYLPLVD